MVPDDQYDGKNMHLLDDPTQASRAQTGGITLGGIGLFVQKTLLKLYNVFIFKKSNFFRLVPKNFFIK